MIVIVAIVVIGPKDMPKVLRKAGQLAARIRRMASDVRTQSGIDEVLREGSLHEDINEIRKLAQADFLAPVARPATALPSASPNDLGIVREREYPREGSDSYGAIPDSALLYAGTQTPSALARDPLYVTGDPDAILPPAPATDAPAPQAPASAAPSGTTGPSAPEPPGATS